MNFTPTDNKGQVEGFCLLKNADVKTSSKGDHYLDATLADADGEINAKLWNYTEAIHGAFTAGQLVKVRGTISVYNGNDQFRIERIRPVTDADCVRTEDFVRSAAYSGEQMFNELLRLTGEFQNRELASLASDILKERRLALLYWPAAFRLHHAIRSGLLLHTLSVVRLCENACQLYPFLNKDLLLTGAMLHDIAKIEEFEVNETGMASGYTVKGNLIGHLAEGAIVVRTAARRLGLSEDLSNLVEHMLLSHHGDPEFGAAVRPMTMEAEVLSEMDMLDARMYEMKEALEPLPSGTFSGKIWSMENRKLYQHGLTDDWGSVRLF